MCEVIFSFGEYQQCFDLDLLFELSEEFIVFDEFVGEGEDEQCFCAVVDAMYDFS